MTDAWSSVSSRRRAELRRETFARYGRVCWLQLPGCTVLATEPDHVVPASRGGVHTVENLRPACRSCNASRQAGPTGRGEFGARVVVLLVEPGAAAPMPATSDAAVVIDPERLAAALTADGELTQPAELPAIAAAAAAGARALAATLSDHVVVYVVERDEQRVAEHRERGSLVVPLAPSRDWSEPSSW